MTVITAIDPGTRQSAWLAYSVTDREVLDFNQEANTALLRRIRADGLYGDTVLIEQVESYGMAVGAEVFETVRWAGRFEEAAHPADVILLPRRAVKLRLCGSAKAKDANIRQALIDRFGGADAIGRKANPGPLYGISRDVWSALAIAVAYEIGED